MPLTHERYQLYLRHPDVDPATIDRIVDDDRVEAEITARIDPYQTPEYTALEVRYNEDILLQEELTERYVDRVRRLLDELQDIQVTNPDVEMSVDPFDDGWTRDERNGVDDL